MRITRVVVHDAFQKKYRYERTEPIGRNFHPDFKPDLTPHEMLALGIFSGLYFDDRPDEFPASWWKGAKLSHDQLPHKELNYFKVHASQPLEVWQKKGWIYKDDPRGWFQWYCRYYMGRRATKEDERQIKRWKAIRRHAGALLKHCERGDLTCRPRQRQALLHWAYDSRKL